jgi:hypothetical protein
MGTSILQIDNQILSIIEIIIEILIYKNYKFL